MKHQRRFDHVAVGVLLAHDAVALVEQYLANELQPLSSIHISDGAHVSTHELVLTTPLTHDPVALFSLADNAVALVA